MLEHVFSHLVLVKLLLIDQAEVRGCGFEVLLVEGIQGIVEPDLWDEFRIRIVGEVVLDLGLITLFLEADGTQGFVPFGHDVVTLRGDPAEDGPRTLEHAVVVQIHSSPELSGHPVLSLQKGSRTESESGNKDRDKFAFHNGYLAKI